MKKGLRHRVNLFLDDDQHRLLKMMAAELVLTLQQAATKLVEDGLFKMGQRVGTVPWAREVLAPLPANQNLQTVGTPAKQWPPNSPPPQPVCTCPPDLIDFDPQCVVHREAYLRSLQPDAEFMRRLNAAADEPAHVAIDDDEEEAEDEVDEFDAQAHYESVVGKIGRKSAILEVQRALDDANWQPATPVNGTQATAGAGPITAAEYEVPPTWVDNAGHTRAQNVARFGEDEAVKYWPPGAAT